MELKCISCEKPIERHDDLINYKHNGTGEWVSYHRKCYAHDFNAPHALLQED